jgi:metaxin
MLIQKSAQLYTIYLSPNSPSIAEPLYILPSSTNPFVRLTLAHELRRAAEKELLKHCAVINADVLYKEADEAFAALEMLLGDDTWFFGNERPGLFDASVFAYTHLLLDEGLGRGWVDMGLRDRVVGRRGLLRHRERIVEEYYAGKDR